MATRIKKCTIGPTHKWDHVRDTTVRSGRFNRYGSSLTLSRKGIYRCACGEEKYGEALTGFPAAEPTTQGVAE